MSDHVIATGDNSFANDVLNAKVLAIVDFWAPWCGPCVNFAPTLEQIAINNKHIKVFKVNVDENEQLSSQYNIRNIPTILFFVDGKEVQRKTGVMLPDQMQTIIDELSK